MVERTSTQFRLPADLHSRLRQAAAERGLTVNRLAEALLAEGLDYLIPVDEIRLTRRPEADDG